MYVQMWKEGMVMEEMKVKINYPDGFNTKYINGAFGGFNGKGDFVMNLFYENIMLPQQSKLITINDIVQEEFIAPENIERNVISSISMSLETAKSIRDWLSVNIEQKEKEMGVK